MQHREWIALHWKEWHAGLVTKLKEEVVTLLTIKSNSPEWFFIIRFSFTSATVHRTHATLIIMKINDLE